MVTLISSWRVYGVVTRDYTVSSPDSFGPGVYHLINKRPVTKMSGDDRLISYKE